MLRAVLLSEITGLLYQETIPDSTLGWPSPGWARRRPDPTLKKEIQVKEWECDTCLKLVCDMIRSSQILFTQN